MTKTIATLQSYKDNGYRLWASCDAPIGPERVCNHFADLDLDALIQRLGPDFDTVANQAFRDMLRCEKCKRRGFTSVRVAAPTDGWKVME